MKRVYAHTLGVEGLVLVCQIVVYKLAASYWGTVGFGEYALLRRTLSLLQPAAMLGLAVALPRWLAWEADARPARLKGYLLGALILLGLTLIAVAAPVLIWSGAISQLFFGDAARAGLVPALVLALVGVCLHVTAYSYLRGRFRQRAANWLQLGVLGLTPLILFLVPGQSVSTLVARVGGATALFATGVLVGQLAVGGPARGVWRSALRLVRFGASRVPADFLHMALLGIPSILVAHRAGVATAGHVAFAFSLLAMAGSAFAPLGLVLLPQASRLTARGQTRELQAHIRRLTVAVIAAALVLTAAIELLASQMLRLYLGPDFAEAVPVARTCLLAVAPYALFMTLRSAIDAAHERALNTRNLALAVGIAVLTVGGTWFAGGSTLAVVKAAVAPFFLLGVLTLWSALFLTRTVQHRAGHATQPEPAATRG